MTSLPSRAAARKLVTAAAVLATSFLAGCSLFGIQTVDEPGYRVTQEQGQYQIREYEPYVIATTIVDSGFDAAGSEAFQRLFGYISGANTGQQEIAMTAPVLASNAAAEDGEEIAMTAPVLSEQSAQGWRYSFVLPDIYTLDTAPRPTDDRVSLESIPARRVAAFQFSGSWSDDRFNENAEALTQWLQQQQLRTGSVARLAAYDSPWAIPFLRRNEILIDIDS